MAAETTEDDPTADADYYDVVVVGAGAGGAAVALDAKSLGLKAAYVLEPPVAGKGASVGADCCALALLRRAAALAFDLRDARLYGWAGGGKGNGGSGEHDASSEEDGRHCHDWTRLADAARSFATAGVQRRRAQLVAANVALLEGRAERLSGGMVRVKQGHGASRRLRAGSLVVAPAHPPPEAVGPEVRGAAALLTRGRAPGRTLVMGADGRAVEAAAALAAIGAQVTLMTSEPELLPGLDRQLTQLLRRHVEDTLGVNCLLNHQVESLSRAAEHEGRVVVRAVNRDGGARADADYDTVFRAEGYGPRESSAVALAAAEAFGAPVFEVGAASHEGEILARRLFGPFVLAAPPCDPAGAPSSDLVIGAVRAPYVEYGYVGLSEEKAIEKLGADGVQVYHSHFAPLEWGLPSREPTGGRCYVKLVCARADEPSEERVLGLHALSPRAAEIAQGFSMALRLGASRVDFMTLAGLHATGTAGRLGTIGARKVGAGAVAESEATC